MSCFFTLSFRSKLAIQGFTLLELLIVMIILSVLSAVGLPTLIGQIGKARETEVRLLMGSVGRAQQAYHYEKKQFADSYNALATENHSFFSKYATLAAPSVTNGGNTVKHQATAIGSEFNRVRNFANGVYYTGSGIYEISLCQSFDVGESVNVGDTASDDCTNSGIKLK